MDIVEANDDIMIDSYASQQQDIDDVGAIPNSGGGLTQRGALTHFVVELYEKTKDPEKTGSDDMQWTDAEQEIFDRHHDEGCKAEGRANGGNKRIGQMSSSFLVWFKRTVYIYEERNGTNTRVEIDRSEPTISVTKSRL